MRKAYTKGLKADFTKAIKGLKKIPVDYIDAWISPDGLKIIQLKKSNNDEYVWLESIVTYDHGINNAGYKLVGLGPMTELLHRLVAKTYVKNDNPVRKTEVNHIDHNKLNNDYQNLEWVTHEENMIKAYKAGIMSYTHIYKGRYNRETHMYTSPNGEKIEMNLARYVSQIRPNLKARILKNLSYSDTIDEIMYDYTHSDDDYDTFIFDLLEKVDIEDVKHACEKDLAKYDDMLYWLEDIEQYLK